MNIYQDLILCLTNTGNTGPGIFWENNGWKWVSEPNMGLWGWLPGARDACSDEQESARWRKVGRGTFQDDKRERIGER